MRFKQTEHGGFLLMPNSERERQELEDFSYDIKVGHSIRFRILSIMERPVLHLTVADSRRWIRFYGETPEDSQVLSALEILSITIGNILCFLGICGERTCAMNLAFPPPEHLPRRFRQRRIA